MTTQAPGIMMAGNGENIMLVMSDGTYNIGTGHTNHAAILAAIRAKDWDSLPNLINIPRAVNTYAEGAFTVNEFGEVMRDGVQMHNFIAERVMDLFKGGYHYEPLLRFMERLDANPSRRAVEELFKFLDKNPGMAICEDGCFTGYKGVNYDFTDCHTGTIDNSPGEKPSMPRNHVDDDANKGCSHGYHVGSQAYASGFGARTVLVKVDPANAVSVPYESCEKLRVCEYEVIREENNILIEPLYREKLPVEDDSFQVEGVSPMEDANVLVLEEDEDECFLCGEPEADCTCDEED